MSDKLKTTEMRHRGCEVAEGILLYFDSYRLGSVAPIATEIEQALIAAYEEGRQEERATQIGIVTALWGADLITTQAAMLAGTLAKEVPSCAYEHAPGDKP